MELETTGAWHLSFTKRQERDKHFHVMTSSWCTADKWCTRYPGPGLNIKTVLSTYGISMLKIRRPLGRLIFNMGIAIPGKTVFLIETAPWFRLYPSHGTIGQSFALFYHDPDFMLNLHWRKLHSVRAQNNFSWQEKYSSWPEILTILMIQKYSIY